MLLAEIRRPPAVAKSAWSRWDADQAESWPRARIPLETASTRSSTGPVARPGRRASCQPNRAGARLRPRAASRPPARAANGSRRRTSSVPPHRARAGAATRTGSTPRPPPEPPAGGGASGGAGHHRLPAAHAAQHGGRGAAQEGGQGRQQDAGQGAAGRDGPDQPGVRDLQVDPFQRSEPAEQAQQGRGQQGREDGGGQGQQQGLGRAQGAEPPAGGAARGEQDALRLLAGRHEVGDEEQCGGAEDGELEGAHHQGRAGDAHAGVQLGEDLRQIGGGPQRGGVFEVGRCGAGRGADGFGLGRADGAQVRGEEGEAVVLQEAAGREGGVVDEQRTVGGQGAGLNFAAAERVEPPVAGVRIGRPVHAGDEHGQLGSAEPVVEPDRCGQCGLGEAEPGERGARHGDLCRCRGCGAGPGGGGGDRPGPLAGDQLYVFPAEGGEQGQVGVLARGGGAGQSVGAAAGHALGGDGKPTEDPVREGPDGLVVLGAFGGGMAAGDHDGGPGLFRSGQSTPQPLLAHATGERRQRGQSGRGDQYGEQHGDGERPTPAQPTHDEAEHVLSSSPIRTLGTG